MIDCEKNKTLYRDLLLLIHIGAKVEMYYAENASSAQIDIEIQSRVPVSLNLPQTVHCISLLD